jgi:hypothetical protein
VSRRPRLRTWTLIVLAGAAIVFADVILVAVVARADFAYDFSCCYQQAAQRALADSSSLYDWSESYTFRYTPLGALLFVPLAPLTQDGAAWAWLGAKLIVLATAAVWFSRPWAGSRRWLAVLLVVAFPPIVHDLVIGNVSTITLLILLAVARWRDVRGGVAIGLLTVLMPKPHLIPILAYVAIRRPRDFAAAAGTVIAGVVLGLIVFGLEPWLAFVGTLREPLERTFTANIGFSGLFGAQGVVIGAAIAAVVFTAGAVLGGSRGYGLSIVAGIIAGPYTFIHYLVGTLVAVEPVLKTRPRWLTPFPWLLVAFPLIPIWLTALAGVIRAAPAPENEAAEPPAEAPG